MATQTTRTYPLAVLKSRSPGSAPLGPGEGVGRAGSSWSPGAETLPCLFSLLSCTPCSPRLPARPASPSQQPGILLRPRNLLLLPASHGTLEITFGAHLGNPGPPPHLEILNVIASAKCLCHPRERSQAQGSGPAGLWGQHVCLGDLAAMWCLDEGLRGRKGRCTFLFGGISQAEGAAWQVRGTSAISRFGRLPTELRICLAFAFAWTCSFVSPGCTSRSAIAGSHAVGACLQFPESAILFTKMVTQSVF